MPLQLSATSEAGAVAAWTEEKRAKYVNLEPSQFFIPVYVEVETLGVFGPET